MSTQLLRERKTRQRLYEELDPQAAARPFPPTRPELGDATYAEALDLLQKLKLLQLQHPEAVEAAGHAAMTPREEQPASSTQGRAESLLIDLSGSAMSKCR